MLAVTLLLLSSIGWLSSASDRQNDSQGWGWFFWLHFSAFFSEILFFWKLVSHGGLDFSIFVSSTIWNQCFRSKNCSTAEGRLQRNSCTQNWLSPSRNQGKTWIVKFVLESVWFRGSDSEKIFCVQNKCKGIIRGKEWSTLSSIPWVEEGALDLHCSLSSNFLGVDCSKEEVRALYVEDYFTHISTAYLYLEDLWSTQSWLQHSWKQTVTCLEIQTWRTPLVHLLHRLTDFSWCSESVFV